MSDSRSSRTLFIWTNEPADLVVQRHVSGFEARRPGDFYGWYETELQFVRAGRWSRSHTSAIPRPAGEWPIQLDLSYVDYVLDGGDESDLVDGHSDLFVALVQDRGVDAVSMITEDFFDLAYWQEGQPVAVIEYRPEDLSERQTARGLHHRIAKCNDLYLPSIRRAIEASSISYRPEHCLFT